MKFGFLARFVAVLTVVTIGIATVLSLALSRAHEASVRSDLIASAFGSISAKLQQPLDDYVESHGAPARGEALRRAIADVKNYSELVRDVRAYPTGLAPVGGASAGDASLVARAVRDQDIIQGVPSMRGDEEVLTAALPMASSRGTTYAGVIAVDFSLSQMTSQAESERRFIILATVGASALIFLSLLTLAIFAQRELNRRERIAEGTFLQTMEGIAAIVDQRDPYTAGHSHRVAAYSVAIAQRLGLSRRDLDDVRWSALLHDLGKIGVPDDVLLKPGALDERERAIISQHPRIGHAILAPVEAMATIAPCVLHHHERYDGKGYPDGLAAEAIPLLSRVIAVADTFDAMTTNRPYRSRLSVETARERLAQGAGTQWDARCIAAAIALIDDGTLRPPEESSELYGQRLAHAAQTTA